MGSVVELWSSCLSGKWYFLAEPSPEVKAFKLGARVHLSLSFSPKTKILNESTPGKSLVFTGSKIHN